MTDNYAHIKPAYQQERSHVFQNHQLNSNNAAIGLFEKQPAPADFTTQTETYLQQRARARLISNITAETGGSTQHSDDAHNKSSSCDGLTLKRNLSKDDAEGSNE